jgi:hypothetical protein
LITPKFLTLRKNGLKLGTLHNLKSFQAIAQIFIFMTFLGTYQGNKNKVPTLLK